MDFRINESYAYGLGLSNRMPIVSLMPGILAEPPLWVKIPWKRRWKELDKEILFRDIWRGYRVYSARLKREDWQPKENFIEWANRVFAPRTDDSEYWGDFQILSETAEKPVMTLLVNVHWKAVQR